MGVDIIPRKYTIPLHNFIEKGSDPPQPNNLEKVLVTVAIIMSPLWFITFFDLFLTPTDILFAIAGLSYLLRSRTLPPLPSKGFITGVGVFLFAASVSILVSPLPIQSFINILQYIQIFFVIIPMTILVMKDKRILTFSLIVIWIVLTVIALFAWSKSRELLPPPHYGVSLWYANHNPVFWLVATGCLISISLIVTGLRFYGGRISIALVTKSLGLFVAVFSANLVRPGQTITAIMMLLFGGWLFLLTILNRAPKYRDYLVGGYLSVSAVGMGVSLYLLVQFWERLYAYPPFVIRLEQYQTAIELGISHFPFGAGLNSHPVVVPPIEGLTAIHNFLLAYFVEIGIFGVIGMIVINGFWIWEAALPSILSKDVPIVYVTPSIIYLTYLVVLLFQPVPVVRFWWVLFAIGWMYADTRLYSVTVRKGFRIISSRNEPP